MPRYVHDYATYFFEKKRDLFLIVFSQRKVNPETKLPLKADPMQIPGRMELLRWFEVEMPEIEVGPLFPWHGDSGMIAAPYDGTVYVDFTPEAQRVFESRWETPDGKSVDPRWQCYLYPLAIYKERYDGRIPDPKEFYDF